MSKNQLVLFRLIRLAQKGRDIEKLSEALDREILRQREEKYKNN